MTLDDVAALLQERGIGRVEVLRDLPYEAFLTTLLRCNDIANRCIVNFDREPVFGVSVGHFSPVAGYDSHNDLVTLLDVTPGFGPTLTPSDFALYRRPDQGFGNAEIARVIDRQRDRENPRRPRRPGVAEHCAREDHAWTPAGVSMGRATTAPPRPFLIARRRAASRQTTGSLPCDNVSLTLKPGTHRRGPDRPVTTQSRHPPCLTVWRVCGVSGP